jgi:PAS domain S-box-containing protein
MKTTGVATTKSPALSQIHTPNVENILGQSDAQFRSLADTAPVLIWGSGADKLCTNFNKPWLDFTGRSLDSELGEGWADGVHPEDLLRRLNTYTQYFDRREKFSMEYRLRRFDGEYRWILDIGVPRFDQDASFVGYMGIAVDVTDRKLVEGTLRESEERFLELAEQSRTTHWEVDPQGLFLHVSNVAQVTWGYSPEEIMGRMHFYDLHPEEGRDAFKAANFAIMEQKQRFQDVVHAIKRKSGDIGWGSVNGIPVLNADGTLRCYRGSCTDITERKLAEEAISGVSRKLIEAHEQERARIGRELHDDIVQRLALLVVQLDRVQQQIPDSTSDFSRQIGDLRNQTLEITTDVQSLSHELHSSKHEYLGIVGAIRNFCGEFAGRQGVDIDFQSHDIPDTSPTNLILPLLRVLQEALHNATKHSGVKNFGVKLWGSAEEIQLSVSDHGVGFDSEAARKTTGLGLTSMQERLSLVGGDLSINSQRGHGTTIHASVPLILVGHSARITG